jgi:hypothetical protein
MSNEVGNYLKFEGAGKLDLFEGRGEENVEFSPACYDVHTFDENTLYYVSRMVPNLQLALEVSQVLGKSIEYVYRDTAKLYYGEYLIENGSVISEKHWTDIFDDEIGCPYECWAGVLNLDDLK